MSETLSFGYSRSTAATWRNWKKGRQILEKLLVIKPPTRLLLVQSLGMNQLEYKDLTSKISDVQFKQSYGPTGSRFELVGVEGELPLSICQHMVGLPFKIPGLYSGLHPYAAFNLTAVPSCCGLCLSFSTGVTSTYMNRGVGTLLMELKEKLAFDAGFGALMGTIISNMDAEKRIWEKFGWEQQKSWINPRTTNSVIMGQKILTVENAGVVVADSNTKPAVILPIPSHQEGFRI